MCEDAVNPSEDICQVPDLLMLACLSAAFSTA